MMNIPLLSLLTGLLLLGISGTNAIAINSALNKTVTMKSVYWPGYLAVDGNLSTNRSECQCCAATDRQNYPWLRVDLGRNNRVLNVVIYGRTDEENNTVQNYNGMEILLHDAEWNLKQAVDTIPDTETTRFHNVSLVTPVIARYVTVRLGLDKRLVVCEIQVFTEGKNLALNKAVTISLAFPDANFNASHAVDGKLLGSQNSGTCYCCAATGTMWNPWIRVDLGGVFRIFSLVVYGRTGLGETFNKMNIYLHQKREWGNVVKTFPTSGVFISETFDPDILARYVTLQQMGNLLTVYCEIEVYGECLSGTFGPQCRTCYCDGSPCDIWVGVCPSGKCLPGYTGDSCDQDCPSGTYGQNCSKQCGQCLNMESCNNVNGTCNPCLSGYTGRFCKTECSNRTFGVNCSKQCGHCYGDEQCNVTSGICSGLCSPGYLGPLCNATCTGKKYGQNCSEECGQCWNGAACDVINGTCTSCAAGYQGELCKTDCDNGTFGLNCSRECGHCFGDEICSKTTGACSRCDPGYHGDKCDTECNKGKYGLNCTGICGKCLSGHPCDVITGNCTNGCSDGYMGDKCNKNCNEGTFGLDCRWTCHCKDNVSCHHVTGMCPGGCDGGWIGSNCSINANIALNKSVEMSSTISVEFQGSNAIDGQLPGEQTPDTCGCCAATTQETDPWLRVDLGAEFRLSSVIVYSRNDSESFNQMNVSVEIEKGIANVSRFFETSPAITNVTFDPNTLGRYISVQLNGNVMAMFCEIEVYGECLSGTFGPNCSTCHCDGSPCDIWDGVCPSGRCLPGYTGVSCDQECANKTYGQNCSFQCGNCLSTCNHVTGSCDMCTPGYTYTDPLCKTECSNRTFGANCSERCGFCFGNGQCNVTTGLCDNGCSQGYKEGPCIESCVIGEYGYNCNMTCGHCYGEQVCNKVTGSCGGMCEAGYEGDNCHNNCPDGTYGDKCRYTCHCMNNVSCDHITGQCSNSSCSIEWRGESCNITTNVALNKTVTMSTQHPNQNFIASHAVDGKLVLAPQTSDTCYCCAATQTQLNPWIRVDLGGVFQIFKLVIYGRNEYGNTFNNIDIYLHLLEWDKGNAVKTVKTNGVFISETYDPAILARYVTLQQMGNLLTVYCEIEVFGECPSGTFGPDCRTCHCDGSPCDIWDGVCPTGKCLPGYTGVSCDQACLSGTFGVNCSEQCGKCLNNDACNNVNGTCVMCDPGYIGDLCNTECSDRTFGMNCSQRCGSCYNDEQCNVTSGECLRCAPGYTGPYCDLTCLNGTYGQNCSNSCGHCLGNNSCDSVDGSCGDCDIGYQSPLCDKTCEPGTFGMNCQNKCGNCSSKSPCNATSGICTEGCDDGYQGIMCNETCADGYFGQNCTEVCPVCYNGQSCHKVTGTCSRCPPGLDEDNCLKERNVQPPPSQEGDPGAVVGIVVTLLLLLAIAGFIGFFMIRRRRIGKPPLPPKLSYTVEYIRKKVSPQRRGSTGELVNGFDMPAVKDTNDHVEISKRKKIQPKLDNYCNIQALINLSELWDFINLNKANKSDYFQKEFKKLKEGLIHKCNAALLLENTGKTRYKGLCAYDHSRVILVCENEGEVDYINANFINGYNSKAKFIASQGPTKAMINDFWRMIWQQEVEIVVMLTNLIELGVKKCIQYWPEDVEAKFGKIHVTIIKTESFKDYDIRVLELRKDGAIYDCIRVVTQYHFRSWPDKDVPSTTWCLVNFWRVVDFAARNAKRKRPVVVHCSAGIGRTGTFLALDILYHQAISEGKIDVFGNVAELREQRVKMVQTLDQYIFLHEAVADAVLFGTHPFYAEQIDEICMFMNQMDKKSNQSGYDVQFRRIQDSLSGSKKEDLYIDGNAMNAEDIGCCNGGFMPLNIVELPGCSTGNVFVTSRAPTNETLPEMLTYIQEKNIRTIIMLTDQNHPQYKTHQGLGTDSGITFGNMSLRFAEETDNTCFIERQFQIVDETETKETLTAFEFRCWIEGCSIPHKMQGLIDMLSNIALWQTQFSEKEPIYVFCEDGVSRSGLVCVLLNEIERLRFQNNTINVVESVKTMKERNRGIIRNAEQLRFCYEAVQLYVQQNDHYANV